jgi:hypothetical protein
VQHHDPLTAPLDEVVAAAGAGSFDSRDRLLGGLATDEPSRSLVDAIVDGQVETLAALSQAAAAVRTGAARLTGATGELQRLVDEVPARVAADVEPPARAAAEAAARTAVAASSAGFPPPVFLVGDTPPPTAVAAVVEALQEREALLVRAVEAAMVGLRDQVTAGTQAVVTHLRHAEAALAVAAEDSAARTAATAEQLAAATADVERAAEEGAERLRAARADLEAAVEARALGLTAAAESAAERLDAVLRAADKRESAASTRWATRVEALVARTDERVSAVLDALAAEVERLVARDAELEVRRAEEFVRVLADQARAPLAGRRLRRSVAGAVGSRPGAAADDRGSEHDDDEEQR